MASNRAEPCHAPVLRTERLTLRALRSDDRAAFDAMHDGENFFRFLGPRRSAAEGWIRALAWAGLWTVYGMGAWVVEDTEGFVGQIVLGPLPRDLDTPLAGPEAGWVFAEPAWGRGYASEAVGAMLAWSDNRDIPLTTCIIEPENRASVRVAEKNGFRLTGTTDLNGMVNVYARKPAC
ncbi:MAG: GNAT family N-acetyltransferase [Pacificimonas sp.]